MQAEPLLRRMRLRLWRCQTAEKRDAGWELLYPSLSCSLSLRVFDRLVPRESRGPFATLLGYTPYLIGTRFQYRPRAYIISATPVGGIVNGIVSYDCVDLCSVV